MEGEDGSDVVADFLVNNLLGRLADPFPGSKAVLEGFGSVRNYGRPTP